MANKLSDILLMIHNTQIKIAIEKLASLMGLTGSSTFGSGITTNVTGNVTGDVLGDVVGDVTGNVSGMLTETSLVVQDDLDLSAGDFSGTNIILTGDGTCDVSDWTPVVGKTYSLFCDDSTTDPTVTLTSGITINAAGNDIMTFGDVGDCIVLKAVSATRMIVLENIGAVALSTAV